jgi:hypothetical protein
LIRTNGTRWIRTSLSSIVDSSLEIRRVCYYSRSHQAFDKIFALSRELYEKHIAIKVSCTTNTDPFAG